MQSLKIDEIITNTNQPRKTFYDESLSELAESIRTRGVLEPIIVRPKNGKYEIVMGERRFRASKLAGLTEIPAIVRELNDEDAAADALLENFQREDLNPIDRAKAIEGLLNFMTWQECAKTLGVSETTLRRHLELLELPSHIQKALIESWNKSSTDCFSEAHARALKGLSGDPATQIRLMEKVRKENLSVTDLNKVIDAIKKVPSKKEAFILVPVRATEEILRQLGKAERKAKPFKAQTCEQHLAALEKAIGQLSSILDPRLIDYLKNLQMNQLLSSCSNLKTELDEFCLKLRNLLRSGDDGFREVYIHCPLCGKIELVGSLRCSVCWTVLRRCLDCGNYDRIYERCAITRAQVFFADAETPKETSASYKCENYKAKFEVRKAA